MDTNADKPIALDDLFSIEALATTAPNALTVELLRWQLRTREKTGLSNACVKVGRRLLISRTRYEKWLGSRVGVEV